MGKKTQNRIVAESIGEAVKEDAADIVAAIPVVGYPPNFCEFQTKSLADLRRTCYCK